MQSLIHVSESLKEGGADMDNDKMKNTSVQEPEKKEEQMSLSDDRRVKVLSPGTLVAKRFFRNRLAVTGMVILVIMFIFSYIGGLIYYPRLVDIQRGLVAWLRVDIQIMMIHFATYLRHLHGLLHCIINTEHIVIFISYLIN